MMTIAAGILEALAGPLFRWVSVPIIAMLALTMAKAAWDKRDARILARGETICEERWEARVRDEERAVAARQIEQQRTVLETERTISEGLRSDLANLASEFDAISAKALSARPGSDPRCLSDGVLQLLRKRQGGTAPTGGDKRLPRT